jgi:DNA-binding NtrC family response regulator
MSDTGFVYVVDDDASVREGVARLIRSAGVMTQTFASGEEFLATARPKKPGCLVLDVNLPGLTGLDLQQEMAKSGVELPIIFLTGHGDIPMTVRALKAGAVNFLTKPFDDQDLLNAIDQCLTSELQDEVQSEAGFDEIVGTSEVLRRALRDVEVVASTDSTVLICGETGTGKELIARAIHNLSPRRHNAFVKLNCAAIPTGLLESELFGHERGAFTGAVTQRIGRFEVADHGTIFLDEVGEIPLELQTKLLRVLQEREFERLGSTRTIRTDARLIAATNRDLFEMVQEQEFRSDLFYRLNVFPIRVPALRERVADIPLLVRHFVKYFANRMNKVVETIPSEAMNALVEYRWPGNIRELQNFIERAVILTSGPVLRVPLHDLPKRIAANSTKSEFKTIAETERDLILETLKKTKWVIAGRNGAADRLGMNRSTLRFRMNKLGIIKPWKVGNEL